MVTSLMMWVYQSTAAISISKNLIRHVLLFGACLRPAQKIVILPPRRAGLGGRARLRCVGETLEREQYGVILTLGTHGGERATGERGRQASEEKSVVGCLLFLTAAA
jgi:hypothetical protein